VFLPISIPIVAIAATVHDAAIFRYRFERRLANVPRCLIGMKACSGAHHIGCQLEALGHDVRLIPGTHAKPFLKGHLERRRGGDRQYSCFAGISRINSVALV